MTFTKEDFDAIVKNVDGIDKVANEVNLLMPIAITSEQVNLSLFAQTCIARQTGYVDLLIPFLYGVVWGYKMLQNKTEVNELERLFKNDNLDR